MNDVERGGAERGAAWDEQFARWLAWGQDVAERTKSVASSPDLGAARALRDEFGELVRVLGLLMRSAPRTLAAMSHAGSVVVANTSEFLPPVHGATPRCPPCSCLGCQLEGRSPDPMQPESFGLTVRPHPLW